MRRYLAVFLLILMMFTISACDSESHEGEARTPSASSIQKGRDYQRVVEEFEKEGFTNIRLEKLEDLITGWLTKDGEVESVSVDGDIDYSADTWYPSDVEVLIIYHTFPEKDENPSEQTDTKDSNPDTIVSDSVLTVKNCPELADILSIYADRDPSYSSFSEKYRGKTIEFDASIDYKDNTITYNPFNGKSTVSEYAYDILVSADDYSDSTQHGPTFKMENLRSRDFGGDAISKSLPDFVSVGSNVIVRAKVGTYNEDTGIFMLHYEWIEAR